MFHGRKSAAALAFTADDLLLAGLREVAAARGTVFSDGIRVTPVLTIMIDAATAAKLSASLRALVAAAEDCGKRLVLGTGVATEPSRDERLVLALVASCQRHDKRVARAAAFHLADGGGQGGVLAAAEEIGDTLRGCSLRLCPVALSVVDSMSPMAMPAV